MSNGRRFPVLIVSAGLAGLSAALLLAWRGVPSLLVEKRASVSRLADPLAALAEALARALCRNLELKDSAA